MNTDAAFIFSRKSKADRLRKENRGNLIQTGHCGSDSLGIDPLVDALERRGMEVVCRNRMVRVKR